jgi:hypothetical protein
MKMTHHQPKLNIQNMRVPATVLYAPTAIEGLIDSTVNKRKVPVQLPIQ